MKLLVSPGFPRCGTSYLYYQLVVENRHAFNVPKSESAEWHASKEPNFFHRDGNAREFAQLYDAPDDGKYFLDFSASYLLGSKDTIRRIVAWSREHTVKCIVVLRHPVEQAFSHYLYDIAAHVARFEFGEDVSYDFWGPKSLERYLTPRFALVNQLIEALGDNVLVLNYHKDIPDPIRLREKLQGLLDLSLKPFSADKRNACGWLPYFVYGAKGGTPVVWSDRVATVPERGLVAASNHLSFFKPSYDRKHANALYRATSTWCRVLSAQQWTTIYKTRFQREFERTLSLAGQDIRDYPGPQEIAAGMPKISREVFQLLPDPRPLSGLLDRDRARLAAT